MLLAVALLFYGLVALHDSAAFVAVQPVKYVASLPGTEFELRRRRPSACTIGSRSQPGGHTRETDDAADLEDESDDEDGSDDGGLPWLHCPSDADQHCLTMKSPPAESGFRSSWLSPILRC
jgi:hypothetical protein